MSDQWVSPPLGHAFASEARREHPVWERGEFGPWRATVTVTPIRGGIVDGRFEVACAWTGPPLAVEPRYADDYEPNPTWRGPPVLSSDIYYTREMQHAIVIARHAEEALRRPARPDLRTYARQANLTE